MCYNIVMRINNIFTNYKSNFIQEISDRVSDVVLKGIKSLEPEHKELKPIDKGELLMSQVPNYNDFNTIFESLNEEERKDIVELCYSLTYNPAWNNLIDGLKKEKLQIFIGFADSNDESNDWLRGSINGMSIIGNTIQNLSDTYKESLKEKKTDFVKSSEDLEYEAEELN